MVSKFQKQISDNIAFLVSIYNLLCAIMNIEVGVLYEKSCEEKKEEQ